MNALQKALHSLHLLNARFRAAQQETVRLRKALKKVEKENIIDSKTGLLNARGKERELVRLFLTVLRDNMEIHRVGSDQPLRGIAILACDVDRLKSVNDAKMWGGHSTGDRFLRAIADWAKDIFRRPTDLIARERDAVDEQEQEHEPGHESVTARSGGDEFIIGFSCDQSKILDVSEMLAKRYGAVVEKNCRIWTDGHIGPEGKEGTTCVHIGTMSIGVSFLTPDANHQAFLHDEFEKIDKNLSHIEQDDLKTAIVLEMLKPYLKKADVAAYAAKDAGRNCVYVWREEYGRAAPSRPHGPAQSNNGGFTTDSSFLLSFG